MTLIVLEGSDAGGRRASVGSERVPDRERDLRPHGSVVVCDEKMRQLFELARRAAQGVVSVMILGETGVGKDVVAHEIHRQSSRSSGPFLRINCAALLESLMESELFGYEPGAFTGAHRSKAGLLESAPGGTIFLDEIAELPARVQAKLLYAIEAKHVLRVGGTRPRSIDVRYIAATNRNLEEDLAGGVFRRDLYYRLSAFSLRVPP